MQKHDVMCPDLPTHCGQSCEQPSNMDPLLRVYSMSNFKHNYKEDDILLYGKNSLVA